MSPTANRVALGEITKLAHRSLGDRLSVPVYSISKHDGFVRSDRYFKKRIHSEDTSNYKLVLPGDFAFSPIHLDEGSIALADAPGLISPMYRVFEVDGSRCDRRYLMRALKTPMMIATYGSLGDGSVHRRRSVPFDRLSGLEIFLPPLDEQRRIAAILDKADALRRKRKRALELLDGLTRSIFLEMFGDPVENPKKLPVAKLGDVGSLDRGISKHRPRNDPALLGGSHPFIQTGDVSNSGGYIRSFGNTYSDKGLAQSKMWPKGTLCITIAANIAQTGILTFDACFPDSVVAYTHPDPNMVQYVRVWLRFLQSTLERSAPASAQKNINLQILRDLNICIPDAGNLARFGRVLEAQLDQERRLRLADVSWVAVFTSLQHRAFSGQL